MTCVTRKSRNRHTTRHHQRESPAPGSARQNRYTNPLHTASAGRRHNFASACLHNGVDIRALAEYLGHHDPDFTLRTYVHLMPDAGDRMRAAVDRMLGGEADGPATAQGARR